MPQGTKALLLLLLLTLVCVEGWVAAPRKPSTTPLRRRFSPPWNSDDLEKEKTLPPPPAIAPMAVVRRRLPVYAGLVTLNALTLVDVAGLIGGEPGAAAAGAAAAPNVAALNAVRTGFFAATALVTAYLGAERQDIGTTAPVTGKSATLAPVFAAVTLGALYAIVKFTSLDPGQLYRVFASIFGWLCLTELLQPLLALSPAGGLLVGMGAGVDAAADGGSDGGEKDSEEQQRRREEQRVMMAGLETVGESEADAARFRAAFAPASAAAALVVVGYLVGVSDPVAMATDVGSLRTVAFFNDYLAGAVSIRGACCEGLLLVFLVI